MRRALAVDPNRSNGVPLNPYYRNPAPGSLDPNTYDDPVTVPAADLADNPYWKRDVRRAYPRLAPVGQADVVALLAVGSAAAPKVDLIGAEGEKQLVAAKTEGQDGGLAVYFEKSEGGAGALETLGKDGLPPLPSGQSMKKGSWDVHPYELTEDQSYGGE